MNVPTKKLKMSRKNYDGGGDKITPKVQIEAKHGSEIEISACCVRNEIHSPVVVFVRTLVICGHYSLKLGPLVGDVVQEVLHVLLGFCYVKQCHLICDLLLELSRASASHILLFIVCTAIHKCSSLGSFSSQHLGRMQEIT